MTVQYKYVANLEKKINNRIEDKTGISGLVNLGSAEQPDLIVLITQDIARGMALQFLNDQIDWIPIDRVGNLKGCVELIKRAVAKELNINDPKINQILIRLTRGFLESILAGKAEAVFVPKRGSNQLYRNVAELINDRVGKNFQVVFLNKRNMPYSPDGLVYSIAQVEGSPATELSFVVAFRLSVPTPPTSGFLLPTKYFSSLPTRQPGTGGLIHSGSGRRIPGRF